MNKPIKITKNKVKLLFTFAKGKRGLWAETEYPCIDSKTPVEQLVKFLGEDYCQKALFKHMREVCQNLTYDSVPNIDNQPGFSKGIKANQFDRSRFSHCIKDLGL